MAVVRALAGGGLAATAAGCLVSKGGTLQPDASGF